MSKNKRIFGKILLAILIFGCSQLPLRAQVTRSVVGKMPKPVLKPLTKDEKLKAINENLSRAKQPTVKNLNLGAPVKLSPANMKYSDDAYLGFSRVLLEGNNLFVAVVEAEQKYGSHIEINFKPSAPGKQFFDCSLNGNSNNNPTTFTISGTDYVDYKPKQSIVLPPSTYTQHLTFILDFPSTKNRSWISISADGDWGFYDCEITPFG